VTASTGLTVYILIRTFIFFFNWKCTNNNRTPVSELYWVYMNLRSFKWHVRYKAICWFNRILYLYQKKLKIHCIVLRHKQGITKENLIKHLSDHTFLCTIINILMKGHLVNTQGSLICSNQMFLNISLCFFSTII